MYDVASQPIAKAHKNVIERVPTKEKTEDTPTTRGRTTAASVSEGVGLAYERFLEFPVLVVLVVRWVSGIALLGTCALLAYAIISALVWVGAEAF